jgi:tetratricopeptide (TPR) repeat protein
MLLAQGSASEGAEAIKPIASAPGIRELNLRVLAAESLAASGKRDEALAMLAGDEPELKAQSARIAAAKKSLPPAITPEFALSELLVRIALDINRERVTPLSPMLARLATFADSGNDEAWLATAQLLSATDRYEPGLRALDQIAPGGVFDRAAQITRVRILMANSASEQALAAIQPLVAQPGAGVPEWSLLGDIYGALERPADAVPAYRKAIDLASASDKDDQLSTLWLLYGSALERSGKWPEAKVALTKAAELAPDQAIVLNYLGYAQLERRENIAEARALIEKAYNIKPGDAAITDSLGWALYLQGNFPGAIEKLEIAAEGEPGGSDINEHLGDAYWSAGRRIEARYSWAAARVTAEKKDVPRLTRKIDFGLEAAAPSP